MGQGFVDVSGKFMKVFIYSSAIVCIAAVIDFFRIFMSNSISFIDLINIIIYGLLLLGNFIFFIKFFSQKAEISKNIIILLRITYLCLFIIVIFDFFRFGFGLWRFFIEICYGFLLIFLCLL